MDWPTLWNAITAIATTISMVAFVLTAIYIREQLKGLDKDRYLSITNELFTTWQGGEFMESQLWLMHYLTETTWTDFAAAHRGDAGEIAFHRVGAFYDRVGTLVRLGLINEREILTTVGGYAIAVWQKIEPLVREARRIEHSTLFSDFERLLPACHECYVPALDRSARVHPFAIEPPVPKVGPGELRRRLESDDPPTLLDVRHPGQIGPDGRKLPGARLVPIDEVARRASEFPAGRDVVVYCA